MFVFFLYRFWLDTGYLNVFLATYFCRRFRGARRTCLEGLARPASWGELQWVVRVNFQKGLTELVLQPEREHHIGQHLFRARDRQIVPSTGRVSPRGRVLAAGGHP